MDEAVPATPVETYESLASRMDLPLLDPVLTSEEVAAGCRLAAQYGLRAVVVRACDVELVAQWTAGSRLRVVGAAGYPDGTSTTAARLYEARDLLRAGAKEIEYVLNPARMVSRQFPHVETELMQISKSCHESGARLTVVYNNRRLADDLKIIATKICRRVEVDTIAVEDSEADLALLRPLLKDTLKMKRATPVRTLEEALAARAQGYSSMNVPSPAPILEEWRRLLAQQAQAPRTPS